MPETRSSARCSSRQLEATRGHAMMLQEHATVMIAVHPAQHVSSKVERRSHKVVVIEEGSRSTVSFTVASTAYQA